MPSRTHEALLELFRNRPALAAKVLREALRLELPEYAEARIESADFTDVKPAEYRADLVVVLRAAGRPALGVIIEAQLSIDERKRYAWPVYAVGLRARLRCPVQVLVVTVSNAVQRWAAKPIELGTGSWFAPLVLGPTSVPVVTDPASAAAEPELAVLSAMAHGRGKNIEQAVLIAEAAMRASLGLDEAVSVLYFDLVLSSLSKAARASLQAMDPVKYVYRSEFARRYLSQGLAEGEARGRAEGEARGRAEGEARGRAEGEARGRAEGEARGRAETLLKLIDQKFGPLPAHITVRIRSASLQQLDDWTDSLLTAASLDALLQ